LTGIGKGEVGQIATKSHMVLQHNYIKSHKLHTFQVVVWRRSCHTRRDQTGSMRTKQEPHTKDMNLVIDIGEEGKLHTLSNTEKYQQDKEVEKQEGP
jgi:hypothetical protein